MAREAVNLVKQKVKSGKGTYEYWYLRWFGADGRFRGKSIGRIDKVSKRQAEKLKRQKENELAEHPGRRNANRPCCLSTFLQEYLDARKSELAPGTLEMHKLTGRYLLGFFGEQRRIDQISRADARTFKTALADGELKHISKRPRDLAPAGVDINIRNARTMFNFAVTDDILLYNPFDRLSSAVMVERNWHYVTNDEYEKLTACSPLKLRLLIALCRLAALRRGEALNLEWHDVDWENNHIRIIAEEDWQPKDKDKRIVPICPELQALLLEAYNAADTGSEKVVSGVNVNNLWRDFQVLFRRSGVKKYSKPFHTLRKSCITDWAASFPAHVVKEWAGHSSLDTTDRYYLQVPESEYKRASVGSFWDKVSQRRFERIQNINKGDTKTPQHISRQIGEAG